jgi:hypothetical protein
MERVTLLNFKAQAKLKETLVEQYSQTSEKSYLNLLAVLNFPHLVLGC